MLARRTLTIIIRRRDAHSMRSATVPESAEPDPICPVCHHGRLTTMHEEWFVLPSAGYPKTSDEGTVERGLPIGVRSCPVCEHVALFLPPTLDASGQPYRRGRSPHTAARTEPQAAASGDPVTPEINAANCWRLSKRPFTPSALSCSGTAMRRRGRCGSARRARQITLRRDREGAVSRPRRPGGCSGREGPARRRSRTAGWEPRARGRERARSGACCRRSPWPSPRRVGCR
jgi:hypothetical protein